MANNKNQHFVPRCHFKPFTSNEEGAAIHLFNLEREIVIPNAPVKHQCSSDYFYGENEVLESAISFIEGGYASALREIRKPGQALTELHKVVLFRFWLLQNMRTETAARHAVERTEKLKAFAGDQPELFAYGRKDAVQDGMHTLANRLHCIDDLKLCLIRNRTILPFITSDNPAVLTNRWYLEDRRTRDCSFGISSSGTLAIFPLTPEIACIAYDRDVYSIPHNSGWVDLQRETDVKAINQHQFLNCNANIYGTEATFTAGLTAQYNEVKSHRNSPRDRLTVAVRDKTEGEFVRYRVVEPEQALNPEIHALFHFQSIPRKPKIWPSFLRWRLPGAVYTNGSGLKYIRRKFANEIPGDRPFWRERIC
jgi:hypothetical protein